MVIVSLVSPVRMMRFDSRDYNEDECISYKEMQCCVGRKTEYKILNFLNFVLRETDCRFVNLYLYIKSFSKRSQDEDETIKCECQCNGKNRE